MGERAMDKEQTEQNVGEREAAEQAGSVAEDWKTRTAQAIRENPLPFLVGAFVAGFLMAKVARHV
jgi:hypothetical protein